MNDKYNFKLIDNDEYGDLLLKCSYIFKRDYDSLKQIWDWLFKYNPIVINKSSTNNRIIIEKSNEIVGHICCFPQKFMINNQPTIFYFGSFWFIDKNANNPSLAFRLAKSFLSQNKNIMLIGNTPSDAAIQIFKRYGSFCVKDFNEDSHLWILSLDNVLIDWILYNKPKFKWINVIIKTFSPLISLVNSFINYIKIKNSNIGEYKFVRCNKIDPEFILFFNKMMNNHKILAVRDEEYLKWRYLQHPSKTIYLYKMVDDLDNMVGYLSFIIRIRKKSGLKILEVLDIFCDHKDRTIVFTAINKIIKEGEINNVDVIKISFLTKEIKKYIKDYGFITIQNQGNKIIIFNNNSHVADSFLLEKNNWYMCSADGDAVLGIV